MLVFSSAGQPVCFEMEMKKHAGLGTDAGAENIILAAFAKAVVGHVWCRETLRL